MRVEGFDTSTPGVGVQIVRNRLGNEDDVCRSKWQGDLVGGYDSSMGFLDLFSSWRRTSGWVAYERQALELIVAKCNDQEFASVLQEQIETVFEIRRGRNGNGYESWPAFNGRGRFFASSKSAKLATIEATVAGEKVVVQIEIAGGMIGRLLVSGDSLPRPQRIVLADPSVVEFAVPIPPKLPEPSPWVASLIHRGLLERGDAPLTHEERTRHIQKLPELPPDFVEFCEQSEGGVALPQTEQFTILGLGELNASTMHDGRIFVPLVDMRECGGLASIEGQNGVFLIAGTDIAPFAPSFKDALNRLQKHLLS